MKLTVEDLATSREKAAKALALREGASSVNIIIHMGDCGIRAGARNLMETLLEDLAKIDRPDIHVLIDGCMDRCDFEPIVAVEIKGAQKIYYQKMDTEKMRRVFRDHVLEGRVQSDLVLPPA